MVIRILIFMLVGFIFSIEVSAEVQLKAAFIRDNQLWMKVGGKEEQLTRTNLYASTPKWSKDGRFIAYLLSEKPGENTYLHMYDIKEKESYQPYETIQASDMKWSPIKNQLAYNSGGILNVTKTKNGRPSGFENVSLGVSDFEWFPNGQEFIASSQSNLLPTGWQPVQLFRIPVDANLNTEKIKPFYTIHTDPNDLFAIDAEYFNWSADGKWVSFLATPTASWSMDSNTLCVLSSNWDQFQVIGKMLGFKEWFKWSPTKNQLAFINGEGRFFVENKHTTITDIPTANQRKGYTPKGYVDLGVEWFSPDEVIVPRAKENKEWHEGPTPTMFTALFVINIKTGEQKKITFPKQNELDMYPQVVGSKITWYREADKEQKREVWVKDGLNDQEKLWLKNIDNPPVFYHHQ